MILTPNIGFKSVIGKKLQGKEPELNLLLDDYPNAAGAYSIRKLNSDYSGSAIRVRRDSDNSEQDIGFSGEDLNESGLLSFVGAGSAYIVTLYDQSGNAKDLMQTSESAQPIIVDSGSYLGYIHFDGVDDYLTNSSFPLTDISIFSAKEVDFIQNSRLIHIKHGGNNLYMERVANSPGISTENVILFRSLTEDLEHLGKYTELYTSYILLTYIHEDNLWKNSTEQTTETDNATAYSGSDGIFLGCRADLSAFSEQMVKEIIIYDADKTSDRSDIETNINDYYSIFARTT